MARSCENGNESSSSVKVGKLLDQHGDYQLLKKDSDARNWSDNKQLQIN